MRERPRKTPDHPRPLRLVLCWCLGGFMTTAKQPNVAKSATDGSRRVNRWVGEMEVSAVEDPTEDTVELCQSTAYAMIHGHIRKSSQVKSSQVKIRAGA